MNGWLLLAALAILSSLLMASSRLLLATSKIQEYGFMLGIVRATAALLEQVGKLVMRFV